MRLRRLWLVLVLAAGVLIGLATLTLYQRSMERAEVLVEQGALAYLMLVFNALEDLDQYSATAARELLIDQSLSAEQVVSLFRHRQASSPFVQDLLILDAEGQALAWGWQGDVPDLTGREYFTHHRDTPGSTVHVSEPQRSIVYEGDWFISVSRALRDEQGALLGVAVGMFSVDALRDRLADLLPHPDLSISLLSRSGRLILRLPEDHGFEIGDDVSERTGPAGIELPMPRPFTVRLPSGLDDRPRVVSFQPLQDYELIAVASITRSEALATWYPTVVSAIVAWLAFAGLSLFLVDRLRRSLARAEASEARFRKVVENASDLIILSDANGVFQYVSPKWIAMLGHERSAVIGQPGADFIHPEDRARAEQALIAVVKDGQTLHGIEYRVRHADGSWRWHAASISPLYDANGRLDAVIGIMRDITDSQQARERLARMAHEDPLTGLPNRARLSDLLSAAMAGAARHRLSAAILFIDLDHFKPVNDEHGHEMGDRLLIAVAQRINSVLRKPDVAVRFGGDEFLAVLYEVTDANQALAIARRIIERIEQPFRVDGLELRISCSIGVALYPDDGDNERDLIHRADQAMYQAKQLGRGRACHVAGGAEALG